MSTGRDTIYNLVGSVVPMIVSLLTVPCFLHLIGTSEYGVLALVWLFLGYFGVFDPGLSRATTYHISRLKDETPEERQSIFWTALLINIGFGLLGGIVLFFVAHPVFVYLLKMPKEMRGEVIQSLPWLALAIPVGTATGILSGVLEGLSKFALVNIINVFGTIAFQLIPLGFAFEFGRNLKLIIAATVIVRLITGLIFFAFAWSCCKAGRPRFATMGAAKHLFSYGSWITITNLIVPLLGTLDKFLIGSYINVANVAVYTIPDNLTRRISVVPGALARSLFPRFSADMEPTSDLFTKSFFLLLSVMTPITVFFILGIHLFLKIWIGQSLAEAAEPVAIVLVLGIFLNSLAYLPAAYLQGTGRPDLNARFHLIEILPHVVFLFIGIYYLKLMGVALAMLIVSGFDAVLLFRAAGLNIWKLPKFLLAAGFIIASIFLQRFLNADSWTSYVPFSILALSCLIIFVRSSPELSDRITSFFNRSFMSGFLS
jgi:O-antigen/teichoic acid export membrane protein